jgi:competence protein ComEC
VTFGAFRLSLGGDAERREWTWWMQHHPDLLGHVQVHKASHHGSNNGDIAAALSILAPEVVIISVGQNNSYGHPRPEALRRYAESGSTVFRTDVNGTIVVEARATGEYQIRVERGEGAKPSPASTGRLGPIGAGSAQ